MKKNVILIFLFIVNMINLSCESGISPINVDTGIYLWVRNNTGKNLLDSTTIGHYKTSQIRVFNLINGRKTEVYDPRMDAPRNFFIDKNTGNGEYFMKLFPYEGIGNPNEKGTRQEITTTFIQWSENNTDTLVCTMTRIDASLYCDKVVYNDVIKYDVKSSYDVNWGNGVFHRFFEVDR